MILQVYHLKHYIFSAYWAFLFECLRELSKRLCLKLNSWFHPSSQSWFSRNFPHLRKYQFRLTLCSSYISGGYHNVLFLLIKSIKTFCQLLLWNSFKISFLTIITAIYVSCLTNLLQYSYCSLPLHAFRWICSKYLLRKRKLQNNFLFALPDMTYVHRLSNMLLIHIKLVTGTKVYFCGLWTLKYSHLK